MSEKVFETVRHIQNPIKVTGGEVFPIGRTTHIQVPGLPVRLGWSRPTSILFKRSDGTEEILRVPDQTRRSQLTMLGLALLAWWTLRSIFNANSR